MDELGRVDAKPGAGWKSARGATPGTRKPRAGYYQIARHEAVAAGVEAGSDEDDDATELPPWNAILRTGEEEEEEEEEEERRRTKCRVFFFPTFPRKFLLFGCFFVSFCFMFHVFMFHVSCFKHET